jgi:hypothetical protein
VKEIGRDIEQEKQNLRYYQETVQIAPQVKAEFAKVRERFEPAASPAVVLRKMKEQIDAVAAQTGLKITKMEDRERRQTGFCDEYVIEVANFEGDEKGVLRFVNELWSSRGMPRVTRLALAPSSGQGSGMVKGSMTVTKAVGQAEQAEQAEQPAAAGASGEKP